ncbi:hypothetical protein KUH03_41415 [Sphingobacterium sp. E70]|uniref:hypothetical protein n=1 Tax=Sphingobacterium sp. E70 TaxID=2853439 RepID=UPI00211CB44D|nr:hypothetical protein [Sphingobacterium sp. E70]ULT25212.1 hypothetical protein KUH03_41415 [Sphingobacterium sp. E70]
MDCLFLKAPFDTGMNRGIFFWMIASIWFSVSENALDTLSFIKGKTTSSLLALTEFSARTLEEDISIYEYFVILYQGDKDKALHMLLFEFVDKNAFLGLL